jgi:hypothetical protein
MRTARAALALERHRLLNGKLPESLDMLVPDHLPAIPADPFDGQPLRYGQLEPQIVIYSIGSDRQDDGGACRHSPAKPPGRDITFRLLR